MVEANRKAGVGGGDVPSRLGIHAEPYGPGPGSLRTPSAGAGRPGFTTPLNPSQRAHPASTGNIKRPSADIHRLHPPTPTRAIPATTSKARSKGWAAVAAKGVDALRGSKRLTNYSKRTPYKSRPQGTGRTGGYRLVSIIDTENPSTPNRNSGFSENDNIRSPTVSVDSVDDGVSPRRSSAPSQLSITPCPVDKPLPSEKPLPSTPAIEPDIATHPPLSRTLLDAKEVPLRWSPPGNPDVQEEWPTLSPLKSAASKSTLKRESEIKLGSIKEEENVAASSREIEVFKDAVSEQPGSSSHDTEGVNQTYAEQTSKINYENNGSKALVIPECHTPSSEETCPTIGSPSPAFISPKSAGFPSSDLPMSASPEKNTTSSADIINEPSKMASSNPFRDRLRAAASSNKTESVFVDKKEFSYTFDNMAQTDQPATETVTDGVKDQLLCAPDHLETKGIGKFTPGHRQSVTKIPRFSPTASYNNQDDNGGETPKMRKFSPNGRSAIPVPSRFIYKNKPEDDPTGGRHDTPNMYIPLGKAVTRNSAPIGDEKPLPTPEIVQSPKSKGDGAGDVSVHHSIDLGNKVTVRQLSNTTPGHGPKLRISPDADRVIMGKKENGSAAGSKEKPKGLPQLGSIRDFRLSTENLFNNLSQKCGKTSLSRSSFSGRLEPEPSPLAGKSVYKAKSADLGSRRPLRYRGRPKELPGKGPENPRPIKFGTNPFLTSDESTPDYPSSGKSTATVFKAGTHAHPESGEAKIPVGFVSGGGQSSMQKNGAIMNANPSPSTAKGSNNDRPTVKRINATPKNESPRSTRTHRPTPSTQGSPRKNFSQPSPGQATPSRPTTSRVNAGRNGHAIISPVPKARETLSQRKRIKRPESGTASTQSELKPKGPTTRGVFSNFRGLFTKHKVEPTKETSGIPQPKHKSGSKSKTSSRATLANTDNHGASSSTNGQGSSAGAGVSGLGSELQSPAQSDTGMISHVAMEILDFARREGDTSRKERLIKLGKILIEAVNHSHDAEKSMLAAIQAAKEAEVSCALAKENALRISQVSREWVRNYYRNDESL